MKDIQATHEHLKKSKNIPWTRLPQVSKVIHLAIAFTLENETHVRDGVQVTFYESQRGTTVHCVVEVYRPEHRAIRGYGKAGGYGYHKQSAALGEALRDAGFTFVEATASGPKNFRIDGTGESWYEETLLAALKAPGLGWENVELSHTLL